MVYFESFFLSLINPKSRLSAYGASLNIAIEGGFEVVFGFIDNLL
jgi:hypothetical protein